MATSMAAFPSSSWLEINIVMKTIFFYRLSCNVQYLTCHFGHSTQSVSKLFHFCSGGKPKRNAAAAV
jgi:hypothetical protein